MNTATDILIEEANQKIAQLEGFASMFKSFADDTRKYRDELSKNRQTIIELTERCENAESALEAERKRPLTATYNIALPGKEEENNGYPRKNKYTEVVDWLEKQKEQGVDFIAASGYNRSDMCRKLSRIFGWEVKEDGVRKAESRKK